MQRNIQRFFDSTRRNNFCIEHLDMAGLVTILKKEAVEASNVINDPKCNKGPKCNNFWP